MTRGTVPFLNWGQKSRRRSGSSCGTISDVTLDDTYRYVGELVRLDVDLTVASVVSNSSGSSQKWPFDIGSHASRTKPLPALGSMS